ncbi:hypothetical protein CL646_03940 [bacterium]|nr:hypothetical protein [bacterium]
MVKNLPTVERSTKIRFGKHVAENQAENTIVFNASNTVLQATNPGAVYLSPIRFRDDFSDPSIVLLMYNKSTGEITESGSSVGSTFEPPLQSITGFGNTTTHTIEFNNPTTSFRATSNVQLDSLSENIVPIVGPSNVLIDSNISQVGDTITIASNLEVSGNLHFNSLSENAIPIVGASNVLTNSPITKSGNKVVITSNLEVIGNVQFANGTITEIKNTDLVVEDRIIGLAHNNAQSGMDIGIVMNYPDKNVAIIHHGDETPKRLSFGYTQNTHTDTSIEPDSNNITVDVLGDLIVQSNLEVVGNSQVANLSVTQALEVDTNTLKVDNTNNRVGIGVSTPTVALDVLGDGSFTGTITGSTITDGTATLSGGSFSGSTATLTTARTIGGVAFDGSANIDLPGVNVTGNQDTTGSAATLTTARTIGGVAFDGSANIDLPGVNVTGNQNTTGSAATLTTARTIGGVLFDGSANIDLPGVNIGGNQNTTGSAATLTTARTIGGVLFDGSANIDLPGVNIGGTQNTTGSAATLTTARLIGGVSFNGSADIDLPGVNIGGNQNTTGSAATLTTARTIGGVAFDGSADIDLPGVNVAGNQNTTGSAATLTTARTIGGVAFDGSTDIVPTTFNAITATSGTFSSTLSCTGLTATSAQISGNLTVNTDAIIVDATNKRVGVGKTPGANLDVLGNVYASGAITSAAGLITGDGGGLSNLQVSSFASDVTLGTDTSGNYVASLVGGDGITTGAAAESATPTVAVDLKTNGGLVIETGQVAVDLAASSITGTLAVADGGTGVTTSTGTTNVVLSDSPTLTGTLTAATANFSGDISAVAGTFTGAVQGASYTGGPISGTTGTYTGALTVTDSTQSTSTSTGSVIISGGVGIAGYVHSSTISAAYDQDLTSYMGRAAVGYMGQTNHASFAHIDNNNTSSYSLKQTEGGTTHLNAKSGQHIRLNINNNEKARITGDGDFYVDTDTLYVDATNDRVGIGLTTPTVELDVSGSVYTSQNITAGGNVSANKVYSSDGTVINSGSVCKKFYSFSGTIADTTTPANAAIKLTFSSNIFYAKIVAHLVEDSIEFSNMSLEVGGGSRAGGATPQLRLGSVSVFGNTSTNPWNSTPDVTTTTGAIIIQPSAAINSGGGSSTAAALYNIFVEYIGPDSVNGKLIDIYQGTSQVKVFNY